MVEPPSAAAAAPSVALVAPASAAVVAPGPPPASPGPVARAALADPVAAPPAIGRPEPTRDAVMSAYRQAVGALPAAPTPAPPPPPRPAPATTVSMLARSASRPAPTPAPAPLFSPFGVSSLARVETSVEAPAPKGEAAAAEPPDLDLLADYVLERLRHELRDGRERLGFLLDDSR